MILVTGGCGFIGSAFVLGWMRDCDEPVVNLDLLTYAGNLESLADVASAHGTDGDGRYCFIRGDVRDGALMTALVAGRATDAGGRPTPLPDALVHFAAESHVDRSILGPAEFVSANVVGTQVVLDAVRAELEKAPRPFRYVQVSTDEVYGSLARDAAPFTERSPIAPNSPYAASKAGADVLVNAYAETFALPALIVRCSNNYGPYQFPEKLIPLMTTRAIEGEPLPVYGDGMNVRDWLHVDDHAAALWAVLTKGHLEDRVYNVGGDSERMNLDVVHDILAQLGAPRTLVQFVPDRLGHDRRYAMNHELLSGRTGWYPAHTFREGLRDTVQWYRDNEAWWSRVRSEAYRAARELYLTPPSA